MFSKLDELLVKYEDIQSKLATPEVTQDPKKIMEYTKAASQLEELVTEYTKYKAMKKDYEGLKADVVNEKDSDMRDMMNEEIKSLEETLAKSEVDLKLLLLPKDPNDSKNVFVEIRGGAGGDESAIFAADLFRMYTMYADKRKWKVEVIDSNSIGLGGYKEIVFMIKGNGAYSRLKFESGVHRVQRVPQTEASGRIHTSTATVAVLAEVQEVDVKIDAKDLKIETCRSSGAGGQHVNTTDSAVRIVHLPTGIEVQCQDERSQLKNKESAMKVLIARIYKMEEEKREAAIASERKSQVGTGDRSEKIRTYNYPQSRVTDHRINVTMYNLPSFMNGDLDEIIDGLITQDQSERLQNVV